MTKEEAIAILRTIGCELGDQIDSAYCRKRYNAMKIAIKTLEQEPRQKGYWIDIGSGQKCSVCGEIQYGYDSFRHFCANCGAEMREYEINNNKKEIEYRVMIKEKSQRNYRLYRVLNNEQDAEDLCDVLQSNNISTKINKKEITKKYS